MSVLEIAHSESKESNEELHTEDALPELKEYSGKTFAIEVASGAIFGGLSVLIGFMWDMYVEGILKGPLFAPGMTWLDILAVPIIIAFMVFGIRSGLIAAFIGCGAILFYPNEQVGWLAMIIKFISTATMIVVPWMILKINGLRKSEDKFRVLKKLNYSSEALAPIGNYSFLMSNAILVRLILTFIFNLFVSAPFYAYFAFDAPIVTVFDDPIAVLTLVGGYTAWNIVQGISDAVLSYIIVYPTTLYKHFATW